MIVFIKLSIQLEHYLKKFRPPSWFRKVPRFIKLFHFFAGDTHLPALFLILYAQTGVKSLKTVNIIYFMLFDFSLLEFCFLSYKSLHIKTFFVGSLKDMNYVSEYIPLRYSLKWNIYCVMFLFTICCLRRNTFIRSKFWFFSNFITVHTLNVCSFQTNTHTKNFAQNLDEPFDRLF